jgi:hypothetical protein
MESLASRHAPADHRVAMTLMRTTASLALLLCATACSEPETPYILIGDKGACGSVVEGASPDLVECPSACPIAVKAFRVINTASCERSTTSYVACINPGSGGTRGAAVLDTPDGPIFVDDPAFDCNGEDGCVTVDTTTTDRWSTCAAAENDACGCVCEGGECAFERFASTLDGCGLPSPCAALTGDTERTEELLQCYLDVLATGGPLRMEVDVPMRNDVTGETVTARRVAAVDGYQAFRIDEEAYQHPSLRCELQSSGFYYDCVPEEPTLVNVENDQGLAERLPCTDPRTWMINCEPSAPMCPG